MYMTIEMEKVMVMDVILKRIKLGIKYDFMIDVAVLFVLIVMRTAAQDT